MNENGQSYKPIVPTKTANKLAPEASAERMEGRGMAKGNAIERPINCAQQRRMVREAIKRIGEAARGLPFDPREEPDAVTPHVRVCGGGEQQCASLLRSLRQVCKI
jgi:hypothetical protein